jgi:TRAP-type mannitol/chloroaromatic compound transport system permease small subunit
VEVRLKALLGVSRGIDWLTEQIGRLATLIVPFVIVVGFLNAVLRNIGAAVGTDLYGSFTRLITGRAVSQNQVTEVQWYLFSLLFFFSFAYILKHGVNVRVDFLYAKWSPRRRALIDTLGTLLFLIPFCLLGIYVTIAPVVFSYGCFSNAPVDDIFRFLSSLTCTGDPEMSSDPGGLPRHWIKQFIIIAFVLLLLQAVSQLIKYLAILTNHPEVEAEIRADEGPAFDVTEVAERMKKLNVTE